MLTRLFVSKKICFGAIICLLMLVSGLSNVLAAGPNLTASLNAASPSGTIVSAVDIELLRFDVLATGEDILIKKIKAEIPDLPLAMTNLKLWDTHEQIQLGPAKQVRPNGEVAFELDYVVAEGTKRTLSISADVWRGPGTDTFYVQVINIEAEGAESGLAATISGMPVKGHSLIRQNSGRLEVAVGADTPPDANIAVGLTGKTMVDFSELKFSALYEDVRVTGLVLTLTDPDGAGNEFSAGGYDFNRVYLYDDSTKLAESVLTKDTTTFSDEVGLFTVPSGGAKVITVKADLFGVDAGVFSGDAPILYIADVASDVETRGVTSAGPITATAGLPSPEIADNFGAMFLYKTKVIVTKNAASPSGSATPGANSEVLRFDVTADAAGDAQIKKITFTVNGTCDFIGSKSRQYLLYKSSDPIKILATGVSIPATGKIIMSFTFPELVVAGTTKTFILKTDTTGCVAQHWFRVDILKGNLVWSDKITDVSARTEYLPIIGGTLIFGGVPFKPGDVSGDGIIGAYDAALVLQYCVGLRHFSEEQKSAADVSGDGTITAYDATLILQYSAEIIKKFPCQKNGSGKI